MLDMPILILDMPVFILDKAHTMLYYHPLKKNHYMQEIAI